MHAPRLNTVPAPAAKPGTEPRPLILALRALAALVILWHHFASYPPLSAWAAPLLGPVLEWLAAHARATQVFFVVGGYVMALSMAHRDWRLPTALGRYTLQRYLRLGLPYLAAMALVCLAYLYGEDWLPEEVAGTPVNLPQLLAHLFFLQAILGYEQLSAGFWFVCINFQLSLVYALTLWLRDGPARSRWNVPLILGTLLSALALFHTNLEASWDSWWLYFFPYFFMGVVIHHAVHRARSPWAFVLYALLFVAAMAFEWRWRLLSALLVGVLLWHAEWRGWGARWPRQPLLLGLGKIAYSLFLVHFPVLVFVAALWTRMGFNSPEMAAAGLAFAFAGSLALAHFFHRWIEQPAATLARRLHRPAAAHGAAGYETPLWQGR